MTNETLEDRVAVVEQELAQLKQQLKTNATQPPVPWWDQIFGTFAGSKAHEDAARLGREYRESLRPKEEEDSDECM